MEPIEVERNTVDYVCVKVNKDTKVHFNVVTETHSNTITIATKDEESQEFKDNIIITLIKPFGEWPGYVKAVKVTNDEYFFTYPKPIEICQNRFTCHQALSVGKAYMVDTFDQYRRAQANPNVETDSSIRQLMQPWNQLWRWMDWHGGWWLLYRQIKLDQDIDHPGNYNSLDGLTFMYNGSSIITNRWLEIHLDRPECEGFQKDEMDECLCKPSVKRDYGAAHTWMNRRGIKFPYPGTYNDDFFWSEFFTWHSYHNDTCVGIASKVEDAHSTIPYCHCGLENVPVLSGSPDEDESDEADDDDDAEVGHDEVDSPSTPEERERERDASSSDSTISRRERVRRRIGRLMGRLFNESWTRHMSWRYHTHAHHHSPPCL